MANQDHLKSSFEEFNEEDLSYFSFRESMRARWKELKHSYSLLKKSPLFFIGFFIIASMVILAILAPTLAPYKCTSLTSCENAIDPTTHTIYKGLPPLSLDKRIYPKWNEFQDSSSQFSTLANANATYVTIVKDANGVQQNEVLIGTDDGRLLLFNFTTEQVYTNNTNVDPNQPRDYNEIFTFQQVENSTYPLPTVPANLTTVIPAIGLVNNDTVNDIVLGGNTGNIYVSLNNGTNANPIWEPWYLLQNKTTGQPYQVNGTSSPSIVNWKVPRQVPLPWVSAQYYKDLIVTSSGSRNVDYFYSKPYGWYDLGFDLQATGPHDSLWCSGLDSNFLPVPNFAPPELGYRCFGSDAAYNYTSTTSYTFDNQSTFYQHATNQLLTLGAQGIFEFNQTGSGLMRFQFSNINPNDNESTDLTVHFASGETYIYFVKGPYSARFLTPFTPALASEQLSVPTFRPDIKNGDVMILDLTGDGLVDMLVVGPQGQVETSSQYIHFDGRTHILGTDALGGDIFSKILYALQFDLIVSISIIGTTTFIGVVIGSVSGYFGGLVDTIFMRVTDVFFAFPDLILAMAFVAVLGPGMVQIAIALVLVDWAGTARLMRGQVLSEKTRLYVEAARSTGNSNFRIIFRHVLPNSIYPIVVTSTLGLGGVILGLAGLSFLGFGPIAGSAELGRMIFDSKDFIIQNPGEIFFPGIVIMLIVLAFNLLGDSLRDILDPRLRR